MSDVEPDSDPPAADPEVRETLDRMEDERQIPDADEAGDPDESADLPPEEGEADEGEEAPTG